MPYVDQGEPKPPPSLTPIVPIVVALVMAAAGAAAWLGSFAWFGMSYPGAILAGLAIGLGAKFTLRQPFPQMRVIAIILTVVSSAAGYYWVDLQNFPPSPVGETLSFYFKDIQALLFTGVGSYLAFVLAAPRVGNPKQYDSASPH